MDVAVISHFGPGYSGGRIHAWFIIEALATLGHSVTVYSDNIPDFVHEFEYMPGHEGLRFVTAPHFSFELATDHDVLFCIPDLGGHWTLYHKVLTHIRAQDCRLVLISYETPNWKNLEQPIEYAISEDYGSVEVSLYADVILANSMLSRDMARAYFKDSPAVFEYIFPPIHDRVADSVPDPKQREKRILIISRFKPRYKNSHRFVEILSDACRGYEFVLMENGLMNQSTIETYCTACLRHCATFRQVKTVSEREKFELIKSCSLTLYPSTFEGYGLPPVESLYCGVPCVAFDLPVLRQVHGDDLIYAEKGDFADFRQTVARTLENLEAHTVNRENLRCSPDVDAFIKGVANVVKRLEEANG
jgi:glycosyltransferase involved in cell wall biosynthesis